MIKIKKIVFGITGLTIGGAERVLVDITNKLCDKYDITIFTIYSNGDLEQELDNKVKVKSVLKKAYKELNLIQKFIIPITIFVFSKLIYKKCIKGNYDTEIAFLEGPITRLLSIKNKGIKKIAWVHNDISKVFGNGKKANIKKFINKKIYYKYDKIVLVSEDNLNIFNKQYDLYEKTQVVLNYVEPIRIKKRSEEKIENIFSKDQINIVSVSRLVEQKAIDRFIEVHASLIKSGIKNKVFIIGEGPLRHDLEKKIKEFNVDKTFILLGKKENPYPYIKNSDCFCLLSHYEGLPIAVLEAKVLKKPIIVTNTAAREAIKNYPIGYVCENNENEIFNALFNFISNKKNLAKYSDFCDNNDSIINTIIELIEK